MRLRCPIDKANVVRISDVFDPPRHCGLDLSCIVGRPVYAMADGIVFRGSQPDGFGTYTRLEADGCYLYVAHMDDIVVANGQSVSRGQLIGHSGDTGNSTGAHAHIEVRKGSRLPASAVDPEPMIEWETQTMLTTLHVQRYAAWQNAFARDVGAQWVKIVNPPENMPLFPDIPNVLVRIWTDPTDAGYIAQGREGGKRYVRDMLPRWRRVQVRGAVYELWNEPDVNSNEGLIQLREATLGAIEEADAQGVTLCVLNIAEGNPHDNGTGNDGSVRWKWNELLPVVKAAIRGGHYLGRHCYWRPGVEGPTGRYHALGRLKADLDMLRDLGLDVANLKVLVNETGIDGGIAGHTPEQGWLTLQVPPDVYRAQIVEAEQYARTIPQIQALMLFDAGSEPKWVSYDHDEAYCRTLVAPLKAIGAVTPPVVPPVVPPTEPLPNDEQGTPWLLAQKARYWAEEMQRQFEANNLARAQAIRLSLIELLIRLEHDLNG